MQAGAPPQDQPTSKKEGWGGRLVSGPAHYHAHVEKDRCGNTGHFTYGAIMQIKETDDELICRLFLRLFS